MCSHNLTEISLKRIKGKRRGKERFRLVTLLLFMGRSSFSARTSLRESSKTSLSPQSIRNALCMVMQPNPTIRWSRLTGTSWQQTDSMAVSMLRQPVAVLRGGTGWHLPPQVYILPPQLPPHFISN